MAVTWGHNAVIEFLVLIAAVKAKGNKARAKLGRLASGESVNVMQSAKFLPKLNVPTDTVNKLALYITIHPSHLPLRNRRVLLNTLPCVSSLLFFSATFIPPV